MDEDILEKTTSPISVERALSQIEKAHIEMHCGPGQAASVGQDRQPPVEREPGQGREGQGRLQRSVVVVVAASETVRLSWQGH